MGSKRALGAKYIAHPDDKIEVHIEEIGNFIGEVVRPTETGLAVRFIDVDAELENELLDHSLSKLTEEIDQNEARTYLSIFGTFHMCHRLSLIISKKSDGPWWDVTECLTNDRVGVFQIAAKRTRERAKRWASKNDLTAPLSSWLEKIGRQILQR